MTQLASEKIESDVIRRITSRLGSAGRSCEESVAAVDYDWRQCHHYGPDRMEKLKEIFTAAAGAIAEKLADPLHVKPDITADSVDQLFAREVSEESDGSECHVLSFKEPKGRVCGFLRLGAETAARWVATLLGDDNSRKEASSQLSE
ncbi:MAG TPA: hypothetical protein VLH60_07180, partial [Sedimentisphaerales bacterium]|nr:hypothetical protein [Sedimentisphaerales bacterium]